MRQPTYATIQLMIVPIGKTGKFCLLRQKFGKPDRKRRFLQCSKKFRFSGFSGGAFHVGQEGRFDLRNEVKRVSILSMLKKIPDKNTLL
jgi:hypothetical protein